MIIYEYYGQQLAHQKITPGDTPDSIASTCIKYEEFTFTVNSGSVEPVIGTWICGATSAATAISLGVQGAITGTWGAGSAVATIRCKSVAGTFSGSENISVTSTADAMTMTSALKSVQGDYPYKGMMAKTALIMVQDNVALLTIDGSIPDQNALIGIRMTPGMWLPVKDTNNIINFKCVDYTSLSASVVQVALFF